MKHTIFGVLSVFRYNFIDVLEELIASIVRLEE
jgi:hypothetical protein